MDRRAFVTALAASGALGATAAARAGTTATPDVLAGGPPLRLLVQHDNAAARALAAALAPGLKAAGIACEPVGAGALHGHQPLAALLQQADGAWVLGITDDATAVVLQAIAATQGHACVLHAHHWIEGDAVQHTVTAPAVKGVLTWSDPPSAQADALARLYAQVLGAPQAPAAVPATPAPAPLAAPASLASFLIRT